MDDPSSSNESNSDMENNFNNIWNIDPKYEKTLWSKEILKDYIYITKTCPVCYHNTFKIYEKKKKILLIHIMEDVVENHVKQKNL